MFAALSVMVFHLGYWSWAVKATTQSIVRGAVNFPALVPFTFWGRFGVETFFIVSGFVIAFSAAHASVWSFMRSRALRLIPAALICATITFFVAKAIGYAPRTLVSRYVASLTFNPIGPWVDGVYWTLGVEISFYAGVLVLLAVRRLTWLEPLASVLGACSSARWIWRAVADTAFPIPAFTLSSRAQELLLFKHGMYFAIGVLLWCGFSDRWTRWRIAAIAFCIAGGACQIYFTVPSVLKGFATKPLMLLAAGIWLATVAAIAASIRYDAAIRSRFDAAALRAIKLGGLATYPLYLVHDVVGAATMRWLVLVAGVPQYVALACSCLAMIVLALGVAAFAEPRVRSLLSAGLGSWSRWRTEARPS